MHDLIGIKIDAPLILSCSLYTQRPTFFFSFSWGQFFADACQTLLFWLFSLNYLLLYSSSVGAVQTLVFFLGPGFDLHDVFFLSPS